MGFLVLDEEAGVGGLGMEGVEGDHGVGQVEAGEQRSEDGDLVGLGVDFALGGDQAGSGHRGEQVKLGAVGAAGAADGLAVHGQRATRRGCRVLAGTAGVAGGEPGADRRVEGVAVDALQDPAYGRFRRSDGAGRLAAGAAESGEHGCRGVGSPLRDRGQGLRAGQHRAGGEREDEGEGMAAALGPARIGHRREAVQQSRVVCGLGRPGSGKLAQASGDGR